MDILKKLISRDGSVKYLFGLEGSNTIESLYMHDKDCMLTFHSTVCVSSQVGCKLGCVFCATGKQGFKRNLLCDEIVKQVAICNNHCTDSGIMPIDAVVFAGMGEPLLNYDNVKEAMHKINFEFGINNFEIATVGVVPHIYRLTEDFSRGKIKIRLNLSLHAPNDELRRKLIPYASQNRIDDILDAAVDYAEASCTKVRIRYTIFKGLNDRQEDAEALIGLLADKPVKLVISGYNENNIPGLIVPDGKDVMEFYNKVSKDIDCGIFHNFGGDIKGGCGQLSRAEAV